MPNAPAPRGRSASESTSADSSPTAPLSEESRRVLIARASAGDRLAAEVLWNAHRRWVAAILLIHRPRELDVDDLMQDVAIKFLAKLNTLRDPEAFRAWLRQIVLNVCRGAARGLRGTFTLDDREPGERGAFSGGVVRTPADRGDTSDHATAKLDSAQRLLAHAMTLPADYREPLLLRCLQGMTYHQIGEMLDLPVTTVETRLARARRMLREEIGDQIVAEELT